MLVGNAVFRVVYRTKKFNRGRTVHWSASLTLSCEPVTQLSKQDSATAQETSLHGLVLRYERDVGFYIRRQPKSVMLIGSEINCTI